MYLRNVGMRKACFALVFSQHFPRTLSRDKRTRLVFYFLNIHIPTKNIHIPTRNVHIPCSLKRNIQYSASTPEVHYRSLDMNKTMVLQGTRGNYDQPMTLSSSAKHDLHWSVNNVETACNVVSHREPALTMTTDASKARWRCSLHEVPTGGQWTPEEASEHMNFLAIKAVLLGLQ